MDEKSVGLISTQGTSSWKVYVDRAANQLGAGVGLVLVFPEKIIIEKSLRLGFSATNNEAEYEVLLMGMTMVQKMGGKAVEMFLDSRLIVGQVKRELEARDTRMQEYLGQVRCVQTKFESFDLSHIPRGENTHANSLATLATSSARNLPQVIIVEDLCIPTPTRKEMLQIHQVNLESSWMDPILLFLERDILPEAKPETEKIRRKVPWFWLSDDRKLYKRSFSGPYLLCVHPETSKSLLEELHVTRGGDPYLTGLLLKDTSGQICKKKCKSMLENVTNVRDSFQTSTSLEEFLILFLALGLLLSGV